MTILENNSNGLKITAVVVGVVLTALTVSSYILGIDHLLGFSRVAMALVLVVAFVKVSFVSRYFMDIRHSPRWLSAVVNGWIAVSGMLVVGLYIGH